MFVVVPIEVTEDGWITLPDFLGLVQKPDEDVHESSNLDLWLKVNSTS